MDMGACGNMVHGVIKSQTQLRDQCYHYYLDGSHEVGLQSSQFKLKREQ